MRAKFIKYWLFSLFLLAMFIGIFSALGIRVQLSAYGSLEKFEKDSVYWVVVSGRCFGVHKADYYNSRRCLKIGDTVTVAFIQGKREVIYGCFDEKSLWRVVFKQRLESGAMIFVLILGLSVVVYLRYLYANSFYMNMNLWRGHRFETKNPQLSH